MCIGPFLKLIGMIASFVSDEDVREAFRFFDTQTVVDLPRPGFTPPSEKQPCIQYR